MAKSGKEKSPVQIAGDVLRHLRELAGLTQTELAQKVYSSQSTISGLERGIVRAKGTMIADIDRALSARDVLNVVWPVTMAGGYSPEFLANLEAEAVKIHDWEARFIPGLLQTPDYAKGVMRAGLRRPKQEKCDELISKRIARQAIITKEDPPLLWFVLDECVLRRPYGGKAAMREQLLKLEQLSEEDHVIIQVMEAATTDHPGGEGPMRIMEYKDAAPVWYTDGWNESGQLTDVREEVSGAMTAFDLIRVAALPPDRSIEFIASIRAENYE